MSVFAEGDNNQTTTETATTSYLKTLVELKGDKWSDPEVVAKGKIDADNYIQELETKIAELSKKADQTGKLDELLTKIGQEAAKPTNANAQSTEEGTKQTQTKTVISEDQIQSLVEKTLTERERTQTATQNIQQVDTQLEELFGTEAKKKVESRAKELGFSLTRLQEIASESPTAFFTLMGEKPKEYTPSLNGTVRTEGVTMQRVSERNNVYYQNLRKTNKHQFYTPEVQSQMMADRAKLGANFYN